MRQTQRLEHGGRIDRSRTIKFTFNGREYTGHPGDTLASALLANGVSIVGRSFKYHRPRGIVGAGPEEPNAIVQVGSGALTRPDQRATQVELFDGLEASTTARLGFDPMGVNNTFSRMLPAGFYYKTFKWPAKYWPNYEKRIRQAAGLGHAPTEADPDRYDHMNAHCDVLVVGAGPAGLAAALRAGRAGARVLLADENAELGGSLLSEGENDSNTIDGRAHRDWIDATSAELAAMDNVRVLTRTTAFGNYDHNFLGLLGDKADYRGAPAEGEIRHRLWRVRAGRVVLATGALERPLVFGNNDRPGIMTVSAVATYLHRYGVCPGWRVVIFTNNDSAYRTALDLKAAGRDVAAVVDVRCKPSSALVDAARQAGIRIYDSSAIIRARGSRRVKSVQIARVKYGQLTGDYETVACDLVASSGGWSPVVHLHCHIGSKPAWDDVAACFLPGPDNPGQCSAGAVTGQFSLHDALAQGFEQGGAAASELGFEPGDDKAPSAPTPGDVLPIEPFWLAPSERPLSRGPKQFVDYQNDTTAADIALAVREGYESVEHVKRYTAMGFGTDQGKLGNINGMAILAGLLDQSIAETGTTTFRPAYTPISFGAVAGRTADHLFDPIRKTAMHDWHVANGAFFEDVGQWKRPWYYRRVGESMQQAIDRECHATRNSVGVLDASTLGKIEVHGADANRFLDMIYTGGRLKMKTGTCRYGLMLHEDGMIFDDGVTAKLGENHYYLTTTTGGAAGALNWLEQWHQTEWPDMDVFFTSVTDQWATIAVNGPKSRDVLQALCDDIDFERDAFPFMTFRDGTVAGVSARVFRISFTGELAFEINVDANYGRHVWDAVMAAGEPYGITPYGTETMHVLRAEKGFIVAGQDTDGSVTPMDMGMHWAIGKKKTDFIGMRSLSRSDIVAEGRKQYVGLKPRDGQIVLPEGAQLVDDPQAELPMPMIGHVSSSYYSDTLGHAFALAVVKNGRSRHGEIIYSPQPDGTVIAAEITDPVFYDREGARQYV
ncbi:sarcosine oxidase subunit alpha family protein [Salinisphaera hydrothermalis]|uniref:sarcosine oxidase subunit alpha family protein n=1 Tax=Salinisphaera hydrothermalis TaxID=563188 RepID=UPI00333F8F89